VIRLLGTVTAFGVIFLLGEIAHERHGIDGEATRKWAHIAAGLTSATLPFFLSRGDIVFLGALFTGLMAASKRFGILHGIHEVPRHTWGEVYFPLGLLILALAVPLRPFFVFGALVMGLSDGLAGVIGHRFGHVRYGIGTASKSYVGSAAFLVCSLAAGTGALLAAGFGIVLAVSAALGVAAVLTLVEAALGDGLDNLVLPPVAGIILLGIVRALR